MVLAASGPSSAAGATIKSASQSVSRSTGPGGPNGPNSGPSSSGSGPRGPAGPSNSQPRSSPAGNAGGAPGSTSRTSNGGLGQGGQGNSGYGGSYGGPGGPSGPNSSPSTGGGFKGSTTSSIGSAASSQRASAQSSGNMGYVGGPPNAAAARASAALNAGLGRSTAGALNTSQAIGVGGSVVRSPSGAALGSFRTATEPVVRNYLSSPQNIADQQAGWSNLSQRARANAVARDVLGRPGMVTPSAPSGQFGPRTNAGSKYLRDAMQMGMITTGMPSELSGLPKQPQGTYSGYGNFNVPNTTPMSIRSASFAAPAVSGNNESIVFKTPPSTSVPSWQQGSYAGPEERILAVEDVPPLGTSVQGGLGALGISSPVQSVQPLRVPALSTREQRDEFYGGGPSAPRQVTSGTTLPSNQQSTYTGPVAPVAPASTPIDGVMKDEAYSYPVKPYGKARQQSIDAAVGVVPVIGQINSGLGAFGYSAGNIFVDEENKLANMTPEQRARYRSYWSDKRANSPGRGDESRGSRYESTALQAYRNSSTASNKPTSGNNVAAGAWEADAKTYGYSEAQLKDPETRGLIKQLWDMGFIPKTAPAA